MDQEAAAKPGIPLLQPPSYPPSFSAPSLSASFKLDEGYSDETRDQSICDLSPRSNDVMTLPDWVLGHSEADRAGEFPSFVASTCVRYHADHLFFYRACLQFATNPPHVHRRRSSRSAHPSSAYGPRCQPSPGDYV